MIKGEHWAKTPTNYCKDSPSSGIVRYKVIYDKFTCYVKSTSWFKARHKAIPIILRKNPGLIEVLASKLTITIDEQNSSVSETK